MSLRCTSNPKEQIGWTHYISRACKISTPLLQNSILYLYFFSFNFAATNFPCILSLTTSKPHLISFIFLLHKYIYKGGEGKGNDPDIDSHKLRASFKKDFEGNTIEKSMEK